MNTPIIMQIILSVIAILGMYKATTRFRARTMGWGIFGVWTLGTLIFLLFVWQPDRANYISSLLGVGRGVDAVLYIGVALLFYISLRIFIRLEKQENLITELVTKIALLENELRSKK